MELTDEQREAVETDSKRVILTACPGSGKTHVVKERVKYLLNKGVNPSDILCLTFTRKGADEMKKRIGNNLVRITTVHGLCSYMTSGEDFHFFTSIDKQSKSKYYDQSSMMDEVISEMNLPCQSQDVIKRMSYMKNTIIDFETYIDGVTSYDEDVLYAIKHYEILRCSNFIVDYDDLLRMGMKNAEEFKGNWKYIIQDESQDENPVQHEIISRLIDENTNYMSVGDPNQSIFGFRGSSARFMIEMLNNDDYKKKSLTRTFRCSNEIIDIANEINNNQQVRNEMLHSEKEGIIEAMSFSTEEESADFVSELIISDIEVGNYSDYAILVRLNRLSASVEISLSKYGIPFLLTSGSGFFIRSEVKTMISYLKLMNGSATSNDVRKTLNRPMRYIGKAFLNNLPKDSVTRSLSEWKDITFEIASTHKQKFRIANSVRDWYTQVKMSNTLLELINNTNFKEYLIEKHGHEDEENQQIKNVLHLALMEKELGRNELIRKAEMAIEQSENRNVNAVTISTIHRAKGLEWNNVFVFGVNDEEFPHVLSEEDQEINMLYVAVTRARTGCFIISNNPSEFYSFMKREIDGRFHDD